MDFSENIPSYTAPDLDGKDTESLTNTSSITEASTDSSTQSKFWQQSQSRHYEGQKAGCFKRLLIKLNIDSLPDIDDGPNSNRDSFILMKQMTQMKGVTRCVSITMIILSIIYLITRI